ncbi:DUF192 domain-containing protein [Candidatus Nitrosopelagicus sp.]|uniref:DUF192 domain-containing protein n=1 Tax=uncultured marine thaumarchaeote KM3_84_E02 TaxID=1456312 RepID=A0A075HTI7_9ARCH|nr:hypothetical protein [uncultured marine thaumarchaeote KM3_84_E02]MDC0159664.1 DUF192 domain-containing protein [Candidatus Nitrosopelagicus sp.]
MPTRLQVLIPISAAAIIIGVAGMLSLPSEVQLDANSNFLMGSVQLDDKILEVYLADTDPRRMRGLMWETQDFLANDKGMLFVFNEPGTRSMWMKNMQFHLDILWFDENGNVVSIKKNVPPCITPLEVMSCKSDGVSADNAQYVLELTAGFIDQYEITENSQLQLISI